jgi:hypothetical protein
MLLVALVSSAGGEDVSRARDRGAQRPQHLGLGFKV